MTMELYETQNEYFLKTLFEDVDDMMIFIDNENPEDSLSYYNHSFSQKDENNEEDTEKETYHDFMIKRLAILVDVFPNTDMEMLYNVANIEWNNTN